MDRVRNNEEEDVGRSRGCSDVLSDTRYIHGTHASSSEHSAVVALLLQQPAEEEEVGRFLNNQNVTGNHINNENDIPHHFGIATAAISSTGIHIPEDIVDEDDDDQEEGDSTEEEDKDDTGDVDEDTTENQSSQVPVGITIAYKCYEDGGFHPHQQQRRLQHRHVAPDRDESLSSPLRTQHRSSNDPPNAAGRMKNSEKKTIRTNGRKGNRTSHTQTTTGSSRVPKNRSSFLRVLLESSLIYMVCVLVSPTFLAVLWYPMHREDYGGWFWFVPSLRSSYSSSSSTQGEDRHPGSHVPTTANVPTTTTSLTTSKISQYWSHYYNDLLLLQNTYIYESSVYQYWMQSYYHPTMLYLCDDTPTHPWVVNSHTTTSSTYYYYFKYIRTFVLDHTSSICQDYHNVLWQQQQQQRRRHRSIVAEDMSIYMDLLFILLCSIFLTMVRTMIVRYTFVTYMMAKMTTAMTTSQLTSVSSPPQLLPADTTTTTTTEQERLLFLEYYIDTWTILVRCKSNHLLSADYYASTAISDATTTNDSNDNLTNTTNVTQSDVRMTIVDQSSTIQASDTTYTPITTVQATSTPEHFIRDTQNVANHSHDETRMGDTPGVDHDEDNEYNDSNNGDSFGYHIDVSERENDWNENRPVATATDDDHVDVRLAPGTTGDIESSSKPLLVKEDTNNATISDSSTPVVVRMNALAVGIPNTERRRSQLQQEYHTMIPSVATPTRHAMDQDWDHRINEDSDGTMNTTTLVSAQVDDDTPITAKQTLQHQLEIQEPQQHDRPQRQQEVQHQSMYQISRYTTAVFRLLYCTITAGIAILYFQPADFWPWYVWGMGTTRQCWDLSGGITVGGMDSDFDHFNVVLKRYFLWQASYHIHSSTFHILLSLLLVINPLSTTTTRRTQRNPLSSPSASTNSLSSKRLHSFQTGSFAYIRSFIQHMLSVVLIVIAYTFSSLRRLGAIGLFAFDISSWSLHLLQICINAPDDSYLWIWFQRYHVKPAVVISRIYWYIVIPSFVITRFIIWPNLWYSMMTDSAQKWLQQLEMTLWSGSALLLSCIMHTLMIVLHALSILYFRRLLSYRYKIPICKH
jgi:hypothetical protein